MRYTKKFLLKNPFFMFLANFIFAVSHLKIHPAIHLRAVFDKSSRPEVFCKKGVLKNFAKFTGKDLCQSVFFNKVAGFRPAILLKKRLWHWCFPVNFTKFLENTLFYRTPLVAASLFFGEFCVSPF